MNRMGKWTLLVFSVAVLILISAPVTRADLFGPVINETEFFVALTEANGSDSADTILVAEGTFDFSNTTITHNNQSTGNLAIIGEGETLTILDGGGINQIININISAGPGNTTLIALMDLTLQNGLSLSEGGAAAVRTNSADLLVDHVRFLENESVSRGGGLYFQTASGDLEVKNSWFFSNRTTGAPNTGGGGMYASLQSTGSAAIEESNFEKNFANAGPGGGAMVVAAEGTITVERDSFTDNDALSSLGGGLHVQTLGPGGVTEVKNCLFAGNEANLGGGLNTTADSGSLSVVNVTAVSNSAVGAGAMYATLYTASATLEIYNSIFHNNSKNGLAGQDIYVTSNDNGPVTVQYNSFEELVVTDAGTLSVTGNINVDPLLDSGYMLSAGSSCIDAGNSSLVSESSDLAGNARIVDDPATVDTGNGIPVVDMGAYEFQPAATGGGGGGGCNTVGPAPGDILWSDIIWIAMLAGIFFLWRRKRNVSAKY
jgi:hypothetical protein